MDALAKKKLEEASQHIAEAEKSLKTSLFKRKADTDTAASEYEKAAGCYKVAKDFNKAIDCFKKSAEYYEQCSSQFMAAKQYEQVALLANESKNYQLVMQSVEKAAEYLISSNAKDSAGVLLEKMANMLKTNEPEKALILFKKAIHLAEVEDKYNDMYAYYENCIQLAVRINNMKEALDLIQGCLNVLDRINGVDQQVRKHICTAVIIHISKDDFVSARNYLEEMRARYQVTGTWGQIEEFIHAYDEKDDKRIKEIIRSLGNIVDNEILKLARKIVQSDDWIKSVATEQPKPAQQQHVTSPESYSSVGAASSSGYEASSSSVNDDEDDLAGLR